MAKFILKFLSLVILSAPVYSQDLVKSKKDATGGSITDYVKRTIVVTGRGSSKSSLTSIAQKKVLAITEARKNCITQAAVAVGGLNVESSTFLNTGELVSSEISLQISEYVRGIRNLNETSELLDDGSVTAVVTAVLHFDGNKGLNALLFNAVYPPDDYPEGSLAENKAIRFSARSVTGIVFDVRDLPIKASMTPHIYTEDGELIHGPKSVTREYALRYGIVGYTRNAKDVFERIGENPFLVKAHELKNDDPTSIIIKNEDIRRLKKLNGSDRLFHECRIAFLIK